MQNVEFAAIKPFLILFIGAVFDQAVSHGLLNPGERDAWVNGFLAISGNVFTMIMIAITLWHAHVEAHKKAVVTKTTETITPNNTTETTSVSTETAANPTDITSFLTP